MNFKFKIGDKVKPTKDYYIKCMNCVDLPLNRNQNYIVNEIEYSELAGAIIVTLNNGDFLCQDWLEKA